MARKEARGLPDQQVGQSSVVANWSQVRVGIAGVEDVDLVLVGSL
jgi:hypothetical protein